MLRVVMLAGVGSLGLAAGSWLAWSSVAAATQAVSVVDDAYVDATSGNSTTTILVGDTVQWTFSGSNQHTVTSTGAEVFDSGLPQTTGTFSHTFNTAGSFSYICGVHGASMSGTVIVQQPAPTNTPQPSNTPASTSTPAPAATNTPDAAASPTNTTAPATQAAGTASPATAQTSTPARSATAGAGAALPTTGGGASGGSGWGWPAMALIALAVGAGVAAGGLAVARRRR